MMYICVCDSANLWRGEALQGPEDVSSLRATDIGSCKLQEWVLGTEFPSSAREILALSSEQSVQPLLTIC